jgi:hypothetical protein
MDDDASQPIYAPDDVKVGDTLTKFGTRQAKGEYRVISIGVATVTVRKASGLTTTLRRRIVIVRHPARNRPWKKPAAG